MKLSEYQTVSKRTIPQDSQSLHELVYGLIGEVGEVTELLKKHKFHGNTLNTRKLQEELGDVLWYLAAIATTHDLKLETIARANISKLLARYPTGFMRRW